MTLTSNELSLIEYEYPQSQMGLVEGKTIHESVFWDEEDTAISLMDQTGEKRHYTLEGNIIEMDKDSYIFVFCGTRGAGKGLTMTRYAAKAAWLYNKRIVSNYKIRFILNRMNGKTQIIESEELDLYKLLCFDEDYKNCLIIIDEAPDIISHMASQSWKNRLLNIFVRQLRKNGNSLFLGSQFFYLIDGPMRVQVDVLAKCKDAFRLYGYNQGLDRGAVTLVDLWDNSGQWTGSSAQIQHDYQFDMIPPDESWEYPGVPIMGAFDTHETQDVWECLAKVDMHFKTYKVGEENEIDESYLANAVTEVETAMRAGKVLSTDLYDNIGELSDSQKRNIGRKLRISGAKRGGHGGNYLLFDNFDLQKFIKG